MNFGPLIFLGVFVGLIISWFSMILVPYWQVGALQPDTLENLVALETRTNWVTEQQGGLPAKAGAIGSVYPARAWEAQEGLQVYRANGCVYCHTQQVRDTAADIGRWGPRRSVAQDYLFENPVQLGSQRIGPDLMNAGLRRSDPQWHLLHLYNPRLTVPGSTMPPYKYLFRQQRIGHHPDPNALVLPAEARVAGYETIPTPAARALVTYVMSLQAVTLLFETPMHMPPGSTNAPGGTNDLAGTNLVATATNATAAATNTAGASRPANP